MTPLERVMAKVELNGDCLLTHYKRSTVRVDGREKLDHWVVYEAHFGAVPTGASVTRTCGNACVNPDHLVLRWRTRSLDQLLDQYQADLDTHCWLWTGSVHGETGHGVFFMGGAFFIAHRESFKRHRGPIPDGMEVLRRCGHPRCINPAHLTVSLPGGTTEAADTTPARLGQRQNHYDRVNLLCKAGHLVVGDNARMTVTSGEVTRRCNTCRDEMDLRLVAPIERAPETVSDRLTVFRLARLLGVAS